jgi:hypothetical protein
MKAPRKTDDDDGGLDSLLDTMTNVVGILVLVLIMTQLGVSETINEVTAKSKVTEADIEEAKEKLVALAEEKTELTEQTESLSSFDLEAAKEKLKRLQEMLDTRKKLLADQAKEANQFSLAIDQDRKTAAKNKKEIEDTKKKRMELQSGLEKSLERRAEIQALLDKTPRRSGPAPSKVVTIPNPRPAPPGAKQVLLVCSGNRLYPMNIDGFRKDAELKAKQIITRQKLNLDPAKGIDPEKFEKVFTKLKNATDDFYNVEFFVADKRWPRIRVIPKEGRGATEQELRKTGSRIRKLLAQLDPAKFYATFYVLPDSFDVYLTARQVLAESGVLAGWEPQSETWVYSSWIPGGVELGPPRPPNPNPPPKGPPKKPANVID